MLAMRLGPRNLLEYDPTYGVLICRECQYAIQKTALQSHLLRHKIYREERQRLLASIAQLNLFEPHHVPLPNPTSPPINALPIISGYRCTARGCRNLCASSKRMRRHWSEIHGLSEPSNFSSYARPVKLQTFFRGTKLRYFEVDFPEKADPTGAAPRAIATGGDDGDDDERSDEEGHDEQLHDADVEAQLPPPQGVLTPPPEVSSGSSPVSLDMETLRYFHHFTTRTSLTLPNFEHLKPATHYWQTDVVLQALQQRWLMCGLLAISACHLAALEDDEVIKRAHRERSVQLSTDFSAEWEMTRKRDSSVETAGVEEEAEKSGVYISYILRCSYWASAESTPLQLTTSEPMSPIQLQSILTTVRSFVVPDFPIRPVSGVQSHLDNRPEHTLARAKTILKIGSSLDAENSNVVSSSSTNIPSTTLPLTNLLTLPSRMASTFGPPSSPHDVLATLSAIAALVECSETIDFASFDDEPQASWRGMATWVVQLPEDFEHMLSRHDPAALVVLAHWATVLVGRAERCGCWFLEGAGKRILRLIGEQLSGEDWKVRSLVRGLMG